MKEFKNFLPISLAHEIHDVVTSDVFPWYWIDDVTTAPEDRTNVTEVLPSQPGFHHTPFVDGKASEWYPSFSFMYHYILDALELDGEEWYLARIRVGMNFPSIFDQHQEHNVPHVDYPETSVGEHYTCLYYVNESDGPTVIFNEQQESENYTIQNKCHPEKNKLMAFNGKNYHASSCPKECPARIAITINLVKKGNHNHGLVKQFMRQS
tara:strand:- start:828 stop:1454 length:627 start_codon:yes stop_codon:yes gene_type:complete